MAECDHAIDRGAYFDCGQFAFGGSEGSAGSGSGGRRRLALDLGLFSIGRTCCAQRHQARYASVITGTLFELRVSAQYLRARRGESSRGNLGVEHHQQLSPTHTIADIHFEAEHPAAGFGRQHMQPGCPHGAERAPRRINRSRRRLHQHPGVRGAALRRGLGASGKEQQGDRQEGE